MKEMARSLLHHASLPPSFWGELVATSIHILNRSLTKVVDGLTPYEVFTQGVNPMSLTFVSLDVLHMCMSLLMRGGLWELYLKN